MFNQKVGRKKPTTLNLLPFSVTICRETINETRVW